MAVGGPKPRAGVRNGGIGFIISGVKRVPQFIQRALYFRPEFDGCVVHRTLYDGACDFASLASSIVDYVGLCKG